MAPKSGIWDNPEFLIEVIVSFYDIATQDGAITPEMRAKIVEQLVEKGYKVSWEAIR